jgi:hypothetical protein
VSTEYDGRQYVGIDLHRRRSVIVWMTPDGEQLDWVRIDNDPVALGLEVTKAGPDPEVVLEATYGWYWAVDALQAAGARVHLAHPLGVKGFAYRRVKNDVRDAADVCDLLRMARLLEAYIASWGERELRELVRHRAKLVALRSGLKAQCMGCWPSRVCSRRARMSSGWQGWHGCAPRHWIWSTACGFFPSLS